MSVGPPAQADESAARWAVVPRGGPEPWGAPGPEEPEESLLDALDYEVPQLVDTLVAERIADDEADARLLFREVKRYLVLVRASDDTPWAMCSRRIDAAWHQFMLFTREYIEFCTRFFGRYVQHGPAGVPPLAWQGRPAYAEPSFAAFQARYEWFYGEPLPDAWYDDKSVTPGRRVINDHAGRLGLRQAEGLVTLTSPAGEALVSVKPVALPALRFIAATDAFYVRELPGELAADEQVLLVAALVELQVLRIAP
jgi:hypothetical protein